MNKTETKNAKSILRQLAALKDMDTEELKARWLEVYGEPAPGCSKQYLQRQLAFRIQELHYNRTVTEEVQEKIEKITEQPRKKPNAAGFIPGTRLERQWKGRLVTAIARPDGFEVDGQFFKSPSAAAKYVTGSVWNGKIFWGVKS